MRWANPLVTAVVGLGASLAGCGGAPETPPPTEVSVERDDLEVVFCVARARRSVRFPAAEAGSIVRLQRALSDPRRGVEATAEPPPELAPPPPAPDPGADEGLEEAGSGGSGDDAEPSTELGDEAAT